MRLPTARKLRDVAIEYAAHGWPVAPLAIPVDGSCQCGDGCDAMHLLDDHRDGITSGTEAEKAWADNGWHVAIVTTRFDVVDLPSSYGARAHDRLKARCPTATARPGRRWDLLVEPGPVRWHLYLHAGTVNLGKVAEAGGALHAGPDDWIVAPPSRTPATGRVGWVVPPMQARWLPYKATGVLDTLGLT